LALALATRIFAIKQTIFPDPHMLVIQAGQKSARNGITATASMNFCLHGQISA
jgi:hypothetical protein